MGPLPAAHAVFGAGLLTSRADDPRVRWFCRVLGLRHLGEAALLSGDSPGWCAAGATGDVLHGVSAVWLARRAPGHARALHANAVVAAGFGVAGAVRWRRLLRSRR
jgi:hypothetical protein